MDKFYFYENILHKNNSFYCCWCEGSDKFTRVSFNINKNEIIINYDNIINIKSNTTIKLDISRPYCYRFMINDSLNHTIVHLDIYLTSKYKRKIKPFIALINEFYASDFIILPKFSKELVIHDDITSHLDLIKMNGGIKIKRLYKDIYEINDRLKYKNYITFNNTYDNFIINYQSMCGLVCIKYNNKLTSQSLLKSLIDTTNYVYNNYGISGADWSFYYDEHLTATSYVLNVYILHNIIYVIPEH